MVNADAPFIGFRIMRPLKQPSAEEAEAFFKILWEEEVRGKRYEVRKETPCIPCLRGKINYKL
jgi:hypothetical protein